MNYKCPNVDCVLGRIADRKSVNGLAYCPVCHGKGWLPESLPIPNAETVFSSDLNITRPKHWRPCTGVGAINGLPSFNGKAIATDGILVVIERPDGTRVEGHLDSFQFAKREKKSREKSEKVDVNTNLFE